jgi:hypothetical protein
MSVQSIAQAAAIKLYSRRFFPYYTFNILGGLDEHGKGAVYSYDPVGSFEREEFRAGGSAATLLQPFLDNQVICICLFTAKYIYVCMYVGWIQKSTGKQTHGKQGKGCSSC